MFNSHFKSYIVLTYIAMYVHPPYSLLHQVHVFPSFRILAIDRRNNFDTLNIGYKASG